MCFQKLLTCLGVKGQTLQESHHQADAVGAGEFQVGRG